MMDSNTKGNKADDNEPSKSENRGSIRRRIRLPALIRVLQDALAGFACTRSLRMFGKKFSSKRLLVSSKVWMHTIPTQNCDIVLTLPATTSDTTLMWLLARLRSRVPQISVHFRHHSNSGIYGLYMTATYESLLQGAEELGIRKPLKSDFGGGIKEFVLEDQECFEGATDEHNFLTSQERQSIVNHMLTNLRATEGEELENVRFLEGQPIVPRLASKKIVSGVFPLHSQQDLIHLRQVWVLSFLQPQPLDKISEYFGVKVGLYFGYIGHYTKWLVFPALLGVLFWLLGGMNQWWEDVSWVVFSIINVFWATLYIINWKRTGAALAYRWGTLDKKDELLKDARPLYKGDVRRSPVTGQLEPYYPAWKRNLFRYFISMPIIILCLCIVFYVMLLIFQLQEWVNEMVTEEDIPSFLRFGPKVLMAVAISALDEVYKQVAFWLNNKENHRLEETHETNLVIKLVLFQFVNSFLALFYIAFYLRDMDRLQDTLAALLITRQILGNMKEVLLPFLKWKMRLYTVGYKIAGRMSTVTLDREVEKVTRVYRRSLYSVPSPSGLGPFSLSKVNEDNVDKSSTAKHEQDNSFTEKDEVNGARARERKDSSVDDDTGALTQAEVESAMTVYDDSFDDYLEMCIQFGYVTLFSSAFPLAALCALLNNLIEIRSDAFKLCYTHQRPFGIRVEDIGIWQDVLQVMVVIAVLVNSALIGMGDLVHRIAPNLSDMSIVVLIVVVEHAILMIKMALEYAIPAVPHEVASHMAKVEFQRREALKRLETQGSTSTSERSPRIRFPDSLGTSPHSSESPLSSPQLFSTSGPSTSRDAHQSLIGHRPQNFNTSNIHDSKTKGGNPWGPADKGQGSPGSHTNMGTPFSDSPRGVRRLPPLPTDDRFRNPFESEVQQIFRQTADVQQIYRRSSESSSGGNASPTKRSAREVRFEGDGSGNLARSISGPAYVRVKSPGGEAVSYYRSGSLPPSFSHRETVPSTRQAESHTQETTSSQRERMSPQRETITLQRKTVSLPGRTSSPSQEMSSQSVTRKRTNQPVSPTTGDPLSGESSVDSPAV